MAPTMANALQERPDCERPPQRRRAEREATPQAAMTPKTPWLVDKDMAPFWLAPVALAVLDDELGEVAVPLAADDELAALEVAAGAAERTN